MKKCIAIFILVLLLFACTPQKRLNRIVKRHPELVKIDTITVTDTIRDTINITTERVELDTVFNLTEIHDTITITKDNLTIRYFHDTIHDKVYIHGECDTIFLEVPYEKIIEVKVPCKNINVETPIGWLYWIVLAVLIVIIGYLLKLITSKQGGS